MNRFLWLLLFGCRLASPNDSAGSNTNDAQGDEENPEDMPPEDMPEDENAEDMPEDEKPEDPAAPSGSARGRATFKAATVPQLRAALPRATNDQLVTYAEAGLSVAQAKTMFARQGATTKRAPGGQGTATKTSATNVAPQSRHAFLVESERLAHETGIGEIEAQRRVAADNPQLYSDYRLTFVRKTANARGSEAKLVTNRTVAGR